MIPTKVQEQLLQDALRQASLNAETLCRPMLGGQGVTVKGNLFALLLPAGIGLRLAPDDQRNFLTIPGTSRLEVPGDPARSELWVVAPDSLVEATPHFAGWVRKAYGNVDRTVPSARRGAPKPGRRTPDRR
jgi:hypothetical protein